MTERYVPQEQSPAESDELQDEARDANTAAWRKLRMSLRDISPKDANAAAWANSRLDLDDLDFDASGEPGTSHSESMAGDGAGQQNLSDKGVNTADHEHSTGNARAVRRRQDHSASTPPSYPSDRD